MNLFDFDPAHYAPAFAERGFVHIPRGLTEEFSELLVPQVEDYLRGGLMPDFAVGDKQQALYQLPNGPGFDRELFEAVGVVCGLDPPDPGLPGPHLKPSEP